MAFDPDNFSAEEQSSGMYRSFRTVDTPMPEDDDGSGYDTEENKMYYYRHGDEYIKLQKVSDNGWSVWRYTDDEAEGLISLQRYGHQLNAQEAHRLALQKAIERGA